MIVRVDTASMTIGFDGQSFPCRIGRGGAVEAAEKREGDGRTPLGRWPVRGALLRPDRANVPPRSLPWRWLRRDDGWCDDPASPYYNRPVIQPFVGSAERLWRDDHVYDVIVTLGINDDPPVVGRGSALFVHVAGDGATEGCVALARSHLLAMLLLLTRESVVDIV